MCTILQLVALFTSLLKKYFFRRVQDDNLDSTIDNLHCGNMKENIKQRFMQRSLGSRPALKKTMETRENENAKDGESESNQPDKKKTRFGMNEKELDSISIEQDDVSIKGNTLLARAAKIQHSKFKLLKN